MGNSRYARLLTHYPLLIVLTVLLLTSVCIVLCVTLGKAPDFSDPVQGFKPRYTDIHSGYNAWNNLLDSTSVGTGEGLLLTTRPVNQADTESADSNTSGLLVKSTLGPANESTSTAKWNNILSDKSQFFCDSQPRDGHSKLVFSIKPSSELLSYTVFQQLCALQEQIESLTNYLPNCESNCMCRSFSLVNYVAYLTNHSSCFHVKPENLTNILNILSNCSSYLAHLASDCWYKEFYFGLNRCDMEEQCRDLSIYEIYHYLIDKTSLDAGRISYTASFLHLPVGLSTYAFFDELYTKSHIMTNEDRDVKLAALQFGLKEFVFERKLLRDTIWIGIALCLVFFIMWTYTESIFITFISSLAMTITLIISFTIYQFIFRITLFPFMNMLACVVVVGIGADDLFIYWKTWTAIKLSKNASILDRIVTCTFRHASSAIFVTSATTATAFFSSAYTDLVTVRCFCIFSGTCVLVNYLLVITWLPACVVLHERHSLDCCSASTNRSSPTCKCFAKLCGISNHVTRTLLNRLSRISLISPLWLSFFLALTLLGCVGVFYWPKLSVPSQNIFQMLPHDHPFEIYDREMKAQFSYELEEKMLNLPLIFVWGIMKNIRLRYFDLSSTGGTQLQPLHIASPEAQTWFARFCFKLRHSSFFNSDTLQPIGCFIEEFRVWMRLRSCAADNLCCRNLTFPYNETTFAKCVRKWSVDISPNKLFRSDPGLRFNSHSDIAAVVISFQSNVRFSYSYTEMQQFYNNVTEFLNSQLLTAPTSLQDSKPFFTTAGGLLFYDIQRTLVTSLPLSLAIVLSASCIVIFLTTLNLLLALCSILTIFCSIIVTLGSLAALNWELNILESVVVSLCIGLSIDFPLHLAVAYRIAHANSDRRNRVSVSLQHVCGSISAAMATTLLAGLCMLPAEVLAYRKLGAFLCIVTVSSWLFSVLFMPSLLMHAGPVGSCTQVTCNCCQTHKRPLRHLDKTVYSDEASSELVTILAITVSSHIALETLHEVAEEEEDNLHATDYKQSQITSTDNILASIPECNSDDEVTDD